MCGIAGYIGNDDVYKKIVEMLKMLEYRGYDSAGIAVLESSNIYIVKTVGGVSNLEEMILNTPSLLGVGHTRWATHGAPTVNNAHPHISNNKKWSLVHNGIIENYIDIKTLLNDNNLNFTSDTDTEVVVQYLSFLDNGDSMQSIIDVCNNLKGSFALAIINSEKNDTLYLAKRKSPLYVAKNKGEVFVASDPICFSAVCDEYYSLLDDEFCEAKLNGLVFYNSKKEKISKVAIPIDDFDLCIDKKQYPHFMLKEIEEESVVFNRIIKTYKDDAVFNKIDKEKLINANKFVFVGCGTAYHAGLVGASYIEKFAKVDARCYVASEFRYNNPIIDDKTIVMLVSQSGETADTIVAEELASKKGATTIALTNVLYSTLAKNVDFVMPVCAGPEIAVASTKAYSAQVTILNMFAKFLNTLKNKTNINYMENVCQLSYKETNDNLLDLANNLSNVKEVFFIGKGVDYFACVEASLKLKEVTYINSQAYPAGELKHGFLALVSEETFVFVIATEKELLDKTLNSAHEASARGAKLIIVTQFDIEASGLEGVYSIIKLRDVCEDLMPVVAINVFQRLSYLISVIKGINPDKPRNLAKSVTVE